MIASEMMAGQGPESKPQKLVLRKLLDATSQWHSPQQRQVFF